MSVTAGNAAPDVSAALRYRHCPILGRSRTVSRRGVAHPAPPTLERWSGTEVPRVAQALDQVWLRAVLRASRMSAGGIDHREQLGEQRADSWAATTFPVAARRAPTGRQALSLRSLVARK
jgi:hypothetical protein